MSTTVKTKLGKLAYVFITGEGRNQALKGQEPRMMFTASIITPKDSELHKDFLAQVNAEWEAYKKAKGVKGQPDTNGIKELMIPDPKGTIDPKTEEVLKIPSGNVIITMKTNVSWKDGKPKKVVVKDRMGKDITNIIVSAKDTWTIGSDSTGVLHGTASGNDEGGKHKVSLYLNGLQLVKLVKYTGSDFEAETFEVEGDDGMGDLEVIVPSDDINEGSERPNI